MENENVENLEQVEEVSTGLDDLESAVNALIDESAVSKDNTEQAAISAEEAYTEMGERLDALEAENKRLTAIIGKMVTAYGARLGKEQSQGVEAFPSTLEPNTVQNENDTIPGLNEIILGS